MSTGRSTAGRNRLIRAIRDRCEGRPYDVQLYVTTMDGLMRGVFRTMNRTPSREMSLGEEGFMNMCWERLEEGKLLWKLADFTFENDTHLVRYTRKVFENLFREHAESQSPGFRARRKQVERVLREKCLFSCRRFCGCWKLKEFRGVACAPANPETLKEAVAHLPVPDLTPPKKPSQRAPSLRDAAMGRYLGEVLRRAGGMARHKDLLSLVSGRYGLFPVRMEPLGEREYAADSSTSGALLLSPEHRQMAESILEGMDARMIDVHYYRVAREMTLAEAARATGCSTSTFFNREAEYKEYLRSCFAGQGCAPSMEEMKAVLGIVTVRVEEKKRTQ